MNALSFTDFDLGTKETVLRNISLDVYDVDASDLASVMISHTQGATSALALLGVNSVPTSYSPELFGFIHDAAPSARALNGSGSVRDEAPSATDAAANRLFDLKVATAEVAMHLERAWRSSLFRQLDDMLDEENWHLGDVLPSPAAFRTFLRLVVSLGRPKRPSIGCADDGSIIASWRRGKDRLTIESRPDDWIRWFLVSGADETLESASGACKLQLLASRLAPYSPETWFYADDEHSRPRRDSAARQI
jgi:hypothetical protein